MRSPISWIWYSCDSEGAGAGLCVLHPGDEYKHRFEKNLPSLDTETMEIVGPVLVRGRGVHDWPGGIPPAPGRAAHRLGHLDGVILASGHGLDFTLARYALWTDESNTALIVQGNNPAPEIHGLQVVKTAEELGRLTKSPEITAVVFTSPTCEACVDQAPTLDRIRHHFRRAVAIDTDESAGAEIAAKEGGTQIPSLGIYQSGRQITLIKNIERVIGRLDSCRGKVLAVGG